MVLKMNSVGMYAVKTSNDKIFDKWKYTGLLYGLSEDVNEETGVSQASECAVFLEKTLVAFSGTDLFKNSTATNCIIPIARKIFGNNLRVCHRNLVSSFTDWFHKNSSTKDEIELVDRFYNYYTK